MKKPTRKSRKRARKVGRPRKSLKQLKISGGYDRNPGRLLKRMGIEPEPEQPTPPVDPEREQKWKEFEELCAFDDKRDAALEKALQLEAEGKDVEADRTLRRGGFDEDEVTQRAAHREWRRSQERTA